jgi:hypothetical protein
MSILLRAVAIDKPVAALFLQSAAPHCGGHVPLAALDRRGLAPLASARLLSDERLRLGFSAPQGHLSDDRRVETFLQGLLLFGPPAFLLTSAPVRIFQLYHAKLVTVPNNQGLIKAVSRQEKRLNTEVLCKK